MSDSAEETVAVERPDCPECETELKAENPSLGTLAKVEVFTARCPSCGWTEKRSEVVV